jgi:GNAT superfamily N-acetyltransferase
MPAIEITLADLTTTVHQQAVVALLNAYASDPMGDGKPLSAAVRAKLIAGLRDHPTTLIFLALHEREPAGIAACFRGFSTFAAQPLINIHDLYVVPAMRGRGVGRLLLEHVEAVARDLHCCKLTLEVQENNLRAQQVYRSYGFSQATLAEEAGGALFLTKPVP